MPRLPAIVAALLFSVTGCFEDADGDDCTPGAEACRCDDGLCQTGLLCIDDICTPGEPTSGGVTTSPVSASASISASQGSSSSTDDSDSDTTTTEDGSSSSSSVGTSSSTTAVDSSSSSSSTGEPFVHVMFVTQAEFTGGLIGSLEAADALCEAASLGGGPHMAILADSTRSPMDRIDIVGPVLNTLGEQVAAGAAELWSGIAATDVGFDENGDPISSNDLAWVGSAEANCMDWDTETFEDLGAFGVPTQPDQWLSAGDTFQCGLNLHIYCVSI